MDFNTETKRDSIAKYANFGIRVLTILIGINLFIAMVIQKRPFPDGTMRMVILVVSLFCSSVAEKKNLKELSKFMFLAGIYWAFMLYPFMTFFDSKPAEDIFLYIFFLLIMSSISVVVYRLDQWWMMVMWLLVCTTTFYFGIYHSIVQLDMTHYEPLAKIFFQNQELAFAIVVCAVLFALITWRLKTEQAKIHRKLFDASLELREREDDISQQNKRLKEIATDLTNTHAEIEKINNSLEDRVARRLKELEDLNEKIVTFGFMHSEMIKNAFENNVLLSDQIDNLQDKEIQTKITKMTTELDKLVFQISENLKVAEKNL